VRRCYAIDWACVTAALALACGLSACGSGDDSGGLPAAQTKSYCAAVKVYAKARRDKSGNYRAQSRRQAAGARQVIPVSPRDERVWWERDVLIQSSEANGADEQEAYAKSPLRDQDDPRYSAMKDRCGVDLYFAG
jgi:hypothetical protein